MAPRNYLQAGNFADEQPLDDEGGVPYQVYTTPMTRHHYDIYLSREITEPQAYDALCQLLRQAADGDTASLYLNTNGGDMASGLALIQSMRASKATITTILHPEARSMGALIFLCGDKRKAYPGAMLMFHNYSSGLVGKGNEQAAEVHANNEWYEQVLQDTCMPFLTKREVKALMQGKDLWLQYPAIQERLKSLG